MELDIYDFDKTLVPFDSGSLFVGYCILHYPWIIITAPLIIIGLILPVQYDFVVNLGILLFSLSVVFSLVTLPVEFNASNRAIRALAETGILTNEELAGAKKVLGAAAMTYVASTFTAIMSLLRLLTIVNNRRGRN